MKQYDYQDNIAVIEPHADRKSVQHTNKQLGFPSYSSLTMEIPESATTKVLPDRATLGPDNISVTKVIRIRKYANARYLPYIFHPIL